MLCTTKGRFGGSRLLLHARALIHGLHDGSDAIVRRFPCLGHHDYLSKKWHRIQAVSHNRESPVSQPNGYYGFATRGQKITCRGNSCGPKGGTILVVRRARASSQRKGNIITQGRHPASCQCLGGAIALRLFLRFGLLLFTGADRPNGGPSTLSSAKVFDRNLGTDGTFPSFFRTCLTLLCHFFETPGNVPSVPRFPKGFALRFHNETLSTPSCIGYSPFQFTLKGTVVVPWKVAPASAAVMVTV